MDTDDNGQDDELRALFAQVTPPPPPGLESFEGVLARYRRGRTRTLAIALGLALVAGPALGVVIGRSAAGRPQTVAAGAPARNSPAMPGPVVQQEVRSGVALALVPGGPPPTRLFVRTTVDGVAVRAYLVDLTKSQPSMTADKCASSTAGTIPCPLLPPECSPASELEAELSDEGAVAPTVTPVGANATTSVAVLQTGFFGVQESTPAAWVAIRASSGVATVRARFSDGATDDMAPVQGYAVLAHRMAPPTVPPDSKPASPAAAEALAKSLAPQGTVEALDASGRVLGTADLGTPGALPASCVPKPGAPPVTAVPPRPSVPTTVAATPATAPAPSAITAAPASTTLGR